MVWVKGELLSEIDAPGVDPTLQLARETQPCLFDRRDWFSLVTQTMPDHAPIIARAPQTTRKFMMKSSDVNLELH